MPERVRLQLLALGPPEVRAGDEVIELPPKLLAVLVFLALKPTRDAIQRDTLLATFWPETDGPHARNALNQVVHQLRRRLGRDVLESRGKNELTLTDYLESDVERFEALLDDGAAGRALDLYRGAFLEGFHMREAPAFERWLDSVDARLTTRATEAALTAAAHAERDGQLDLAVGYLRRVLEIVPTCERAARRLIRLLLSTGERDAALREYRWLVQRLESELGASPSDATRAVIRKAGADPSVPEAISRPARLRRLAGDLTERATELLKVGRGENLAARELLEQAIRADPEYAPAYAVRGLAICHWVELHGGPWGALKAGRAAAGRALKIAPELPEAHLARGMVLHDAGRLTEAIRSYRSALRLNPRDATAASRLGLALYLGGDFTDALDWIRHCSSETEDASATFHGRALAHLSLGQHDIADEWHQRAISSHPEDRRAQSSRVYHFFTTGRTGLAIRQAREMANREPDTFIGLTAVGDTLFVAEDFKGAITAYERCYSMDPDSRNWGHLRATRTALGYSHLRAGDAARGRKMLEVAERQIRRLLATRPSFGALPWELAAVLAAQGRSREALSWLEHAYEHGWLQHEFLEMDPIFTDLRTEPRFHDVLSAMRHNVEDQRKRLKP